MYDNPSIIDENGLYWKVNDKLHRTVKLFGLNGFGIEIWFKDRKKHRIDGPAIIFPWNDEEYWINDKKLSKEEFNKNLKDGNFVDPSNISIK